MNVFDHHIAMFIKKMKHILQFRRRKRRRQGTPENKQDNHHRYYCLVICSLLHRNAIIEKKYEKIKVLISSFASYTVLITLFTFGFVSTVC